ncbi:hypothetical protein ACHHYP_10170 [Achlya hypogyna]|uniref:F-box domain-containing protein n=1 Tax=Achlya hypogyna TaxID=1202772 RepID=A0A1V9ZIG1_ACHHY|nr:hypothetical protein ACHHYP_10170 [Achlya hypogyna]
MDVKHFDDERSDCWQLRVCALLLSVCTFGVFLFIELVPQQDVTLLALGTLMVAWIGPLTLLAGTQSPATKGYFTWWQPFEGGFSFVCMQAFGWSMIALFLALCLVIIANFHTIAHFEGQFLLLGIVAFIAQALLNLSIDQYVVPDATTPASLVQRSFLPGWSKALVAMLVSISGTIFFVVYDSGLFASAWVLIPMGVLQFSLSAVLLHLCVGAWEIPGYRLWQPFEGGAVFLLLQFFGWNFFTCMVVSSACLVCLPSHSYGLAVCTGLLGFVSQVLLISSLYCFKATDKHALRWTWSYMQVPEEGFLSGIFAVFACLLTALVCHSSLFPGLAVLVDGNTRLLGIVCLIILAGASPVAHCGGYRSVPGYKLWQPFVGDPKFVFLQSMGWLWYGTFLGISLLLLLNDDAFLTRVLPLACVMGSLAAVTIALSMPFFASTPAAPRSSSIWTGEYVLSLLLSFATIVLHLGVELLHLSGRTAFVCLALGLVASSFAAFITHAMGSRLHPTYAFWQPFRGGDAYVLRQALAWTFFSIFVLFDCVLLGAVWNHMHIRPGMLLALSLYALVPHVILASSIAVFAPSEAAPATDAALQPLRMSMLASAALDVGSTSLFCCAEGFRGAAWSFVSEVLFVIATIVAVIGIACTHCICGPQLHPGYRFFQPLQGGLRFVVYQGVGWTLAVMAWVAACTVIYWHSSFLLVHGVVGAIGMMFFVAQSVLLGSLRCFAPSCHSPPQRLRGRREAFLGPILGMVSCAAFALVDLVLLRCGATLPAFPMTICAACALFASIPLTFRFSTRGRMVYQVLGYTLWSFTLLLAGVFTYNVWHEDAHMWLGVLTGAIGLAAHFVLLCSLAPPDRLPPVALPASGVAVGLAMWAVESAPRLLSLDALVAALVRPLHAAYLACCVAVLVLTWLLHRWLLSTARVARPVVAHATLALPPEVLLHLCAFLHVADVAAFASVSKAHHDDLFAPAVWHALFAARHGGAAADWRAVQNVQPTPLFSNTLCVRVERGLLHWLCDWDFAHARAWPPPVAPLPPSLWKGIVGVTAHGGAFYACEVCRKYEVLTSAQMQYELEHACAEHQTSSWVAAPCACRHPVTGTPRMAHRRCLERHAGRAICGAHRKLAPGWRPATTLVELSRTAPVDAGFVLSGLKVLLALGAALQLCGFGWKAPATYLWLVNTALLSAVLQSARFDDCIQRIWQDAWAFPLYLRLYYLLSASSLLLLLWVSPLWTGTSLALHVLFTFNMVLYAVLSSLALFAFWKTHGGVRTVLTTGSPAALPLPARCTLCRLHLCSVPSA